MPNDRDKARSEDFDFMVLCHAKGNPAMYELFRDRSLDKPDPPPLKAGDTVTYTHYGEPREGVIHHIGESGKIVFLVGGTWLHRESVTKKET